MSVEGLISPRAGAGVCARCFNLTRPHFDRCYACDSHAPCLDAMVPISYSVGGEQLHHDIADYKRDAGPWVEPLMRRLSAILATFVAQHEVCLGSACGAAGSVDPVAFDLVTTVPSQDQRRDNHHPLRQIVGRLCAPTKDRHERLLLRTDRRVVGRGFDPERYTATRPLDGASVLLIDDMWTTGASAQSAAAALKEAGAGVVGAIVIARHLNREWHRNDLRLRGLAARPFDFTACPLCAQAAAPLAA
jgi:predicted amidophosphoribosyltransferase